MNELGGEMNASPNGWQRWFYCKSFALVMGKEVVYTSACETATPSGNWDDFEYLGEGTYSRMGERW